MKKLPYQSILIIAFLLLCFSFSNVNAQSTSLQLIPAEIETTFFEIENTETVVAVNLTLNDIVDMKKFEVILTFDGTKLEYYTDHAGDWGYSGSRSTNPTSSSVTMSGELTDGREMSGSGTFYSFVFKILDTGSSEVRLNYLYLEDKTGSSISYSIENNNTTIEVLPLATWVNGVYQDLMTDHELLIDEFQAVNENYQSLLAYYSSIEDEYTELNDNYQNLISENYDLIQDYEDLLADFVVLNSSYFEILSNFNSLENDYALLETEKSQLIADHESLQSSYTSLSSQYDQVSEKLLSQNSKLNTITAIMIVFIVSTLILALLIIYFLKKGRKTTK